MPPETDRIFVALGILQSQVSDLSDRIDSKVSDLSDRIDSREIRTIDEQRKVHDIVDATSEAVRNLTRIVNEMKPLTDDYREKRAEWRGAARFAGWLYGAAGIVGGGVVVMFGKILDYLTNRPHIPLIALILLALLARVAFAQEHHHPTETITGATALFYETWMRPDQPTMSCCNRSDCTTATEVKQIAGQWFARRKTDGKMISVPPEKVEQGRDSPDGQSHICSVGTTVFCFIVGAGG